MNSTPKPNLAELSKLAADLKRIRISPAIKIQRILALVHSDHACEMAFRSFRNMRITSDEADLLSMIVRYPITPQTLDAIAREVDLSEVDILVSETEALPKEWHTTLKNLLMKIGRNFHFMPINAFPLASQEEVELHQLIQQRRAT